jgi:gas vesicle protein
MTERPQQSTDWSSLVAGMLAGAVVGALAAVLYAPRSGRETRADVLERLDALKACVDQTAQQVTQLTKERLAEMQADLHTAIDAGRHAAADRVAELRHQTGLE